MDDFSDEDLRKQLKAYGKDVGPINNSTRPYWKKALSKLSIEHNVSPITSVQKKEPKKKKIICEENKFVSPKTLVHTSKCAGQSISDEDLSDSEDNSIVTDSPGSTPFPTKSQRIKKSPLKKNIKNSPIESLAGYNNRKNCHHSTTPTSSSRTTKVKRQDNKSIVTQPKDGETRKKFKEHGVKSMHQSPMTDAMREQWRKLQKKQQSDDFKDYQDTFGNANEHKICFQEFRSPNIQLGKCIKMFLIFALKGIIFAILIIIGISFIISSEDIKRIEEGLN